MTQTLAGFQTMFQGLTVLNFSLLANWLLDAQHRHLLEKI